MAKTKQADAKPLFVLHRGDCLNLMREMPAGLAQLVFTSPPYPGKLRRYGDDRTGIMTDEEWVEWMKPRVREMVRVCSGMVGIVANGRVKAGVYAPAVEALLVDLWREGVHCERTTIWHKNSPPNRRDWFGNDWEPILWFYSQHCDIPWNWEAIGSPPKYSAGGRFRQRTASGQRRLGNEYPKTKITRPRDVLRVTVGGGHLGWKGAHENEAPFPLALVEPFIQALTNPGDIVLDPFCGSSTTGHAAFNHGRSYIGIDARQSQIDLSRRRFTEVLAQHAEAV